MPFLRHRTGLIISLVTFVFTLFLPFPGSAQSENPIRLPQVTQQPVIIPNLTDPIVSDWIWLDGRRLFKVAATQGNLSERTDAVQQSLEAIKQNYLRSNTVIPKVEVQTNNNLPVITVNNQQLLTITSLDAELRGVDITALDDQIKTIVEMALQRTRAERQPQFLKQQGIVVVSVILFVILCNGLIHLGLRRLSRPAKTIAAPKRDGQKPFPLAHTLMDFSEVLRQVLGILQISIGLIGLLICLDRFPYTRPINIWLLNSLSIPFKLTVVGLFTYLLIRLSWVLVNRSALLLTVTPFLTPKASQRMLLRISTITNVIKGFAVPVWISIGVIVALMLLNVDVGPLLAGVGLVGVALSLASQSIIKDALNGFLVLVEDQFGVGDVIQVGDFTGVVESLNLRMTQIRNAEGQLITIPNSEIRIVANLSSKWSRVDLNIPIPYHADVDLMLELIEATAQAMADDSDWEKHILEPPQLMGVEDFDHRGPIVKVWIKTQPLQQWAVSRELRRRLKIAFDKADIDIPSSQHQIWLHHSRSENADSFRKPLGDLP